MKCRICPEIRQNEENNEMTEEQFWDKFNEKHNPKIL